MTARRLADIADATLWPPVDLDELAVCYWKQAGRWMIWLPGPGLGDLSKHQIVDHEDGTISVVPSILVGRRTGASRHGFLERGIWREA